MTQPIIAAVDCIPVQIDETTYQCKVCGFLFENIRLLPIHKNCDLAKPPWLMGDWLARQLAALGIAKSKGCKCDRRQAWLNRISLKIQRMLGKA